MNIYLNSEMNDKNLSMYNKFIYDGKEFFYEKENTILSNGFNLGEKHPTLKMVLDKLEEIYKTNFVLIEIECSNIFRLSTQIVAKNIRLTDLDLPKLIINKMECEFVKTDSYKIINGNTKVNLITNLIEYIFKDGQTFFDDSFLTFENTNRIDKQIKILKQQLNKDELNEVNKELIKRNIKTI